MVSFDITNLFIPIQETLQLLNNIIYDHMQDIQDTSNMMRLMNLCMDQHDCRLNERIYSMTDGVPMGSPLSCIMADVFMNELEYKIMNNDRFTNNILLSNLYVDDVLVIWKNTPDSCICTASSILFTQRFTSRRVKKITAASTCLTLHLS